MAQIVASDTGASGGPRGIVVPIVPKTDFDNSFLANGEDYETIVQNAIAVPSFTQAVLLVRTHASDIANAGNGFTVELWEVDPSDEDGADFVESSAYLTSDNIDSATTAPHLSKNTSATKPGPYLRVIVRGDSPRAHPENSPRRSVPISSCAPASSTSTQATKKREPV